MIHKSYRNLRFLKLVITFFVVLINIAACNSDLRVRQTSPGTTSTLNSVYTSTHISATHTATATAKPPPSSTPTRSALVTPTPSIVSATPTRTIIEREDYFRKMLNPTVNCAPPCWWGLTPGLTTWQETLEFFYGLNAPVFWIAQDSYGVDTVIDHSENIRILLEENNSLLENILIIGEQTGFRPIDDFPFYWKGYSPESVLKAYGAPTRVLLRTNPLRYGDRHPYKLFMIYDNYGFVIYYSGFTKYGQVIKICPRIGEQNNIGQVKLFFQPTESRLPLERMAEWGYPDKELDGTLPLENATGISVDEFYQLFTAGDQSGCIETPAEIWKTNG